ncbi:lipid-A-disaccharide synthase [Luteolibacter ambystomatis]|uniref:Lipid-A-disaccharide synthase n=2 Tax=Luteolibacter ambystomatis TaxID=2824561 RepID=A0A975G914_9BACT|nr:lipid-A-disaccharide synthase [Luteolibacter ambystomatis]QUE50930.1 lipid-A-disaccharide synthase [Luteolibacter ambystomatis]
MGARPLKMFLSAGEVSGDFQAAQLARTLQRIHPGVELVGYGGDHMRSAGVEIRCDTAGWGYVGIQESLRFLPEMRRARAKLAELLKTERPDLVVLVDGEAFNERLVAVLQRERIPFVHYFVPQVWFWGRWRARRIARQASLVIPAFPKELEIFRECGARAEWFGHPLLDLVEKSEEPCNEGGEDRRPVALMPGSRVQEIESHAPTLIASAKQLRKKNPGMKFLLPVAAQHLRAPLLRMIEAADMTHAIELRPGWSERVVSKCRLALVASGTATLETALAGVPMVAFYKVRKLTFWAAKLLVKSRFVAMPNILLDESVVPELLQENFTVDSIVSEASALLDDPARAAEMRRNLARIPAVLGGHGAIERAAWALVHLTAEHEAVPVGVPCQLKSA